MFKKMNNKFQEFPIWPSFNEEQIEIISSSITKKCIQFSLSKKYKSIIERKITNKIKPITKSGIELNILTKTDWLLFLLCFELLLNIINIGIKAKRNKFLIIFVIVAISKVF